MLPLDSHLQKQRARRDWLRTVANVFEASSGTIVNDTRLAVIAQELDAVGYTHAQAVAAEAWIKRGAPARYGTLTLADFFPTAGQLAEVSFDLAAMLRREYERGRATGSDEGRAIADAEWQANADYLAQRERAAAAVDLTARINALLSREKALAEAEERFEQRVAEAEAALRMYRAASRVRPAEAEPAPTLVRHRTASTLAAALSHVKPQEVSS